MQKHAVTHTENHYVAQTHTHTQTHTCTTTQSHICAACTCTHIHTHKMTHRYAAFGLGSRAYPNFCTFAHTCDNLLKDLGAEQIFPCGEGDELCGQEESFQVGRKEK